jgi:hypothetical protein
MNVGGRYDSSPVSCASSNLWLHLRLHDKPKVFVGKASGHTQLDYGSSSDGRAKELVVIY